MALVRFCALLHILVVALLSGGAAQAQALKVVAFGDSLTAGFGLPAQDAFTRVLEQSLRARGLDVTIENAGVSGDTTAAGLQRLDWSIPDDADAVLLELGANDALRGQDPGGTRENLDRMLARLKGRGIPVMLLGMRAPRNLGASYAEAFDPIFPELAAKHGVPLYPFFLDGVAAAPELNQPDGIHPNAEGVRTIVARLTPSVEAFLRAVRPRTP
jgi:acyl-CoA thioesterase I